MADNGGEYCFTVAAVGLVHVAVRFLQQQETLTSSFVGLCLPGGLVDCFAFALEFEGNVILEITLCCV